MRQRNNGGCRPLYPSCVLPFISKLPLLGTFKPYLELPALPSYCLNDGVMHLNVQTGVPGLTCFAMSQHISLMFAGSNLLHRNLLTASLSASLGDKWNCFLRRLLHLQFPCEKCVLETVVSEAVLLRGPGTPGTFSRVLACGAGAVRGHCASEAENPSNSPMQSNAMKEQKWR